MKKTIFTLFLCGLAYVGFGQLKVHADGDVNVGNNAAVPTSDFQISSKPGNASASLKFKAPNTSALFNYFDGGGDGLSSQWNVDLTIGKPNGLGTLGYFRSTNTTGNVSFLIFRGNNSPDVNCRLGANVDSYLSAIVGNTGIGTNAPIQKLHVQGNGYKTQGGDLWSTPSDRRLKSGVKKYKVGLDIISKLEPIKYTYNGKGGTIKGEEQIGVFAQDLAKIAPFMVKPVKWQKKEINDNGEEKVLEEEEILTINVSALKWITVNAINEQQKQIEDKDKRISDLEGRLGELEELMEELVVNQQDVHLGGGVLTDAAGALGQNVPNPFRGETQIQYFIPENSAKSSISIFDMQGKLFKTIPIDHTGRGQLNITEELLPAGTYSYQLVVGQNIVGTKKMILSK